MKKSLFLLVTIIVTLYGSDKSTVKYIPESPSQVATDTLRESLSASKKGGDLRSKLVSRQSVLTNSIQTLIKQYKALPAEHQKSMNDQAFLDQGVVIINKLAAQLILLQANLNLLEEVGKKYPNLNNDTSDNLYRASLDLKLNNERNKNTNKDTKPMIQKANSLFEDIVEHIRTLEKAIQKIH